MNGVLNQILHCKATWANKENFDMNHAPGAGSIHLHGSSLHEIPMGG